MQASVARRRRRLRVRRRFLAALRREAEDFAERHGSMRGPVRPQQRPASRLLDRLAELEEQAA